MNELPLITDLQDMTSEFINANIFGCAKEDIANIAAGVAETAGAEIGKEDITSEIIREDITSEKIDKGTDKGDETDE